jgi:midasin (ATPase involved in ribosome maturation)
MGNAAPALMNRAQRFALNVPMHYRKSGISYWQDGKTVNISRTGILFQTDEILAKDSVLDLRVSLPLKVTLTCQGTIVRSEESKYAVRIHRHRLLRQS